MNKVFFATTIYYTMFHLETKRVCYSMSVVIRLLLRILASLFSVSRKLDRQNAKLDKIVALLKPEPATTIKIDLGLPELKTEQGENNVAAITTDQNYPNVQLVITNKRGQPAPVEGVPAWASSDATVLAVTPSADGMSAVVDTVAPGTARITVTADADLGPGTATITGVSEDVSVTLGTSGQASVLTLNLGTPADKP